MVAGTLVFGCQTFQFDYSELLIGTPRTSLSSVPSLLHASPVSSIPAPTAALVSAPATLERPQSPVASSSIPSVTVTEVDVTSAPMSKNNARYSYPPTPPADAGSTTALLLAGSSAQPPSRPAPPPMQISHFVLTPTSRHRVRHHGAGTSPSTASASHVPSLFSRFLPSALHDPKANSYTSAFELDVKPPSRPLVDSTPENSATGGVPVLPPRPPPLLTFLDETPTFSVRTQGSLEINSRMEARFGVDRAFWISVSLAFLEFLEQRDVRSDRVGHRTPLTPRFRLSSPQKRALERSM